MSDIANAPGTPAFQGTKAFRTLAEERAEFEEWARREAATWSDIANFLTLYEAMVKLRPPLLHERQAYKRAVDLLRSAPSLPIPASLR